MTSPGGKWRTIGIGLFLALCLASLVQTYAGRDDGCALPGWTLKAERIALGVLLLLLVLPGLFRRQIARAAREGLINPNPPRNCPACGSPLPRPPRWPADLQEALWGGWTCKSCGSKIDRWGRIRSS